MNSVADTQFAGKPTTSESAENYAVADAKNLPFSDGQFDLVVAYSVLMDAKMYR